MPKRCENPEGYALCWYCGKQFKTIKAMDKHEPCEKNPHINNGWPNLRKA